MTRALALDGPRNGEYVDIDEAEALGYTPTPWQEAFPETVLLHTGTVLKNFGYDGVPVEFEDDQYPHD